MKTIKNKTKVIIVLMAVLGLQASTIFASVTPMVANLNDGAPLTEINIRVLAPATPAEADFEEPSIQQKGSPNDILSPVTPATADFEDQV